MGWLGEHRRKRILERLPLADDLWEHLISDLPIVAGLEAQSLAKLRVLTTLFAREKRFEGRGGITIDDFVRAMIAIQAVLPILELGLPWYERWRTVIVLPDQFTANLSDTDNAGVVHEWQEELAGEAWQDGPVSLSWSDVEASGWGDGFNVIIHEAVHQLDMTDGAMNGRPELGGRIDTLRWRSVMSQAFSEIRRLSARPHGKRPLPIDRYAAESPAEFFAVTSEYFFERPGLLATSFPAVYDAFLAFYRWQPVGTRGFPGTAGGAVSPPLG